MKIFELRNEIRESRQRAESERTALRDSMVRAKQALHENATSGTTLASSFAAGAITGWLTMGATKKQTMKNPPPQSVKTDSNNADPINAENINVEVKSNSFLSDFFSQTQAMVLSLLAAEASRVTSDFLKDTDLSGATNNSRAEASHNPGSAGQEISK